MGDKFQKMEWKNLKTNPPSEDGSYLILRETGTFAVASFEGNRFRSLGNVVAWADIPVPTDIPAVPAETLEMMQLQKKMCALRAKSRALDAELYRKKRELQNLNGFHHTQTAYYM